MKRLFLAVAALWMAACTSSVFAAETMAPPRDSDRNCSQTHDRDPFAFWHSGDGVMRFSGAGIRKFEFYGQGIDLSPAASITGISGATAEIVDRRVGIVNSARGCGNIASVVVEVTLPRVSSANSGVLHIGSEAFDIRAVPVVVSTASWEEDNFSNGASLTLAERQARDAVLLQVASATCQQRVLAGENSCIIQGYYIATTLSTACQAFIAIGATCDTAHSRAAEEHGTDFQATVGNCGDEHGVQTALTSSTPPTLTVTLPNLRDGAVLNCWNQPLLAEYDRLGTGKVTAKFPDTTITTTLAQASNGAPPLSFRDEANDFRGRLGVLNLTRNIWHDLVGTYTYDLTLNPTSDSAKLRLIIKSQPGFAVKAIGLPPLTAAGRVSSSYRLIVTPLQKTAAGQTFRYDITNFATNAPCFTVNSGEITPSANLTSFDIPLTVTENSGCFSRTLTVRVVPVGADANDPRFAKTLAFTVPPRAATVTPVDKPALPTTLKPNLP